MARRRQEAGQQGLPMEEQQIGGVPQLGAGQLGVPPTPEEGIAMLQSDPTMTAGMAAAAPLAAEGAAGAGVDLPGAAVDAAALAQQGPIGREEIAEAMATLRKYKEGKVALERRIIENEDWWKLQHWRQIKRGAKNPGDPEPASGWLFNCIANKHADAMDNYPEPNVLPRERDDEADAKLLSSILPVVLEQNDYEQAYSDMWWYKLKAGTGVMGIFWDARKENGLGDVDIRPLDLLNLFWQPGITDIQKSRNLFHVELVDRDVLLQQYPGLKDPSTYASLDVAKYVYDDNIDTTDKCIVVDWYYKLQGEDGRTVLHYCKFTGETVLYASQNDPVYATKGYYDHGKYPVVFDTLFPEEGTPAGFGYIDVCKDAQIYIDKLDQVILKHAVMGSRPRFFVRGDGNINEAEYADWTKDFVHYSGNGDPNESIMPVEIPNLSEAYLNVRSLKIDELKETSGNRDFSQGGTSSGVTAASAIAALQEAGSKLSRDMIKSAYRSHAAVCYMVIDLMRQFYTESRYFRIVGERGQMEFVQFTGRQIAEKPLGPEYGLNEGFRVPIFDIKVTAQKSSPYSTVVENERAKELYGMGFFRPDLADQALAALDMMSFQGKEKVRETIANNGTMYQQLQMMQQQMAQMAAIIDAQNGTTITDNMLASWGQGGGESAQGNADRDGKETTSDAYGNATKTDTTSLAGKARTRAASAASPA